MDEKVMPIDVVKKTTIWDRLIDYLTHSMGVYTFTFAVVAMFCWYKNGQDGTHYDIRQLIDIYTFIVMQLTAKYGLDSWLNSPSNKKPE